MKIYKTPRFLRLIFKQRTWGFALEKNGVYLTFDDGPHPDITPWVLDELQKHQIKATFFCVGENVKRYPEIYRRILDEGHTVGNHTMRHENALKVKPADYIRSVNEASKVIDSSLFRPPYGRLTPALAKKLRKHYRIVMWSWLSYDFDLKVSVDEILAKAEKQIQPGHILVLHDNPKITARQHELLPQLIALIYRKGLSFHRMQFERYKASKDM